MQQIIKISLISLFILFVYVYLFYSGTINYFVLGSDYYFIDYRAFPRSLECFMLGYNPTTGSENTDCKGFDYGYALLVFAPFKEFIINSNLYTIPSILIFFFTIISVKIINPKKYSHIILCLLALLNPSTLLLIERMNLDIFLYLILCSYVYSQLIVEYIL